MFYKHISTRNTTETSKWKIRFIALLVTVPLMSRQKSKFQIFLMEVNFQFIKAYNIPDTLSIQSLPRRTDTTDVGGVKGTMQHFLQNMKSHLPVLSNVKRLMLSQISE
jgi:hypothetical protein